MNNLLACWQQLNLLMYVYVCMYACIYVPIYLSIYLPTYLSIYSLGIIAKYIWKGRTNLLWNLKRGRHKGWAVVINIILNKRSLISKLENKRNWTCCASQSAIQWESVLDQRRRRLAFHFTGLTQTIEPRRIEAPRGLILQFKLCWAIE